MFKSLIRTFAIVAAFIAGYMMPGLHVYSWTFKWMLIVMLFVTFLGIRFKRMKPERAHWLLVGANAGHCVAAEAEGRHLRHLGGDSGFDRGERLL